MTTYLWLKLVHILSATVLFGTGLGTAFSMLRSYLSGSEEAMRVTTRNVVLADWLFTTPAVIIQLATGLWLTSLLSIDVASRWFMAVIGLYVFVGLCWLPVVWIQIRIRNLIADGRPRNSYASLMRAWTALGILAFSAVLVIFYLMVSKAGISY
jgi:uncharacterized membrane protein